LNLNASATEPEILHYIHRLYRYLILKKNGLLHHIITSEIITTLNIQYSNYDYLLHTIPVIINIRQYDITVQYIRDTPHLTDISLETCSICYEEYTDDNFVQTNCQHSFCVTCIINTVQILPSHKTLSCAMCRTNITHLLCYTNKTNTKLKNTLHI
jgi:hypothetical protein